MQTRGIFRIILVSFLVRHHADRELKDETEHGNQLSFYNHLHLNLSPSEHEENIFYFQHNKN